MKNSITIVFYFLFAQISTTGFAQISPVWQTYFGGNKSESVFVSHKCSNGDYLLGGSSSSDMEMPYSYAINGLYGGGVEDGFVARFNTNGELLWWTFFGGEGSDFINSIQELEDGSFWVGGSTSGTIQTTKGTIKTSQSGSGVYDCFIARFSSGGVWLEGTMFGGDGLDRLSTFKALNNGRIILVGLTNSLGMAVGEVWDSLLSTENAAFVAVLESIYAVETYSYFEGNAQIGSNEIGDVAAITEDNEIIFYGSSFSTEGVLFGNAQYQTPFSSGPGFIVRLTPQGFPIWGTYYNFQTVFRRLKALNQGLFAIYGKAVPGVNLTTDGVYQTELIGQADGLVSLWNNEGELLWTSYLGSNDNSIFSDDIRGVAMFEDRVVFSGVVARIDNISTPGAWQAEVEAGPTNSLGFFGWLNLEGQLEYLSYLAHPLISTSVSSILMDGSSLITPVRVNGYNDWIMSPELNQEYKGLNDICLMKFDTNSGIENTDISLRLNLYPNPAQEELFITGVNVLGATVTVYDSLGKVCLKQALNGALKVSELNRGAYMVLIHTKDGAIHQGRFIKL
jgi:hypothetical protein